MLKEFMVFICHTPRQFMMNLINTPEKYLETEIIFTRRDERDELVYKIRHIP